MQGLKEEGKECKLDLQRTLQVAVGEAQNTVEKVCTGATGQQQHDEEMKDDEDERGLSSSMLRRTASWGRRWPRR